MDLIFRKMILIKPWLSLWGAIGALAA
jgi:hypothetical protein